MRSPEERGRGAARLDANVDRDALVAMFNEHAAAVYRYCLTRTGNATIAEEATSEAFLAAARVFADGNGGTVDRPWLFVVARRRMIDQWRSEARHKRRATRAQQEAELVQELEHANTVQLSERSIAAIESLPSRQRFALALRYLDGYSVQEVAGALEISYQAAESILARARRGFVDAWNLMIDTTDGPTNLGASS